MANLSGFNVALLLGNNDGSFAGPFIYQTYGQANSIVVGDFNTDGRTDFAVGMNTSQVAVFLNATPNSVTICPTGIATFNFPVRGIGPFTYQWEWMAPSIQPTWSSIVEGSNTGSMGQAVFIATNATTASVEVTRDPSTSLSYSDFNSLRLRVIVTNACGNLMSNEATLTICPSDFNCDGFVTGEDFDEYLAAFEDGTGSADFNGDGFVTGEDFDGLVAAFESGC